MTEEGKESALVIAEKEIINIVKQRSSLFFEKRRRIMEEEIENTRNLAASMGNLQSSSYAQMEGRHRSEFVRDIVLERFKIAQETRNKYRMAWTEQSLIAMEQDLRECTEGQFRAQKEMMQTSPLTKNWAQYWRLDQAKENLEIEISREISALGSEQKVQRIARDQNPEPPRSVQINISGDQSGVLNVAGEIDSIQQNLSIANDANERQTVEAIKNLTQAVIDSNELSEENQRRILEHLEFLSRQAILPHEKREKPAVVLAVLSTLEQVTSLTVNVHVIWSRWGSQLQDGLRTLGII